ncbi:hypothetical protein [Mucilaginibacter glaciei]|uniref:Uncharacterized protein n=1 Tax=Mucilaginibacter glaciei TaxID=2772109 RepID=A0A926NTY4_9SPHI|nr:hypothetical protein [Mucilaginibacter glaciei]MBD1395208.1 hypothetical protein [Mucilaginibacter glaciei]
MDTSIETEFNQQRLFYSRKFRLTKDGFRVRSKTLFKQHEYELNYEEVGSKIITTKDGKNGWLISSSILILLAAILLIVRLSGGDVEKGAEVLYGSFGVVCGIMYAFTFKNSIYLVKSNNQNAIEFLNNNPSKEKLEKFISIIKSKRKDYLINRYGTIRKSIGYEQQCNELSWLYDNNVIDELEYKDKIRELESIVLNPVKVVGFTSGSND